MIDRLRASLGGKAILSLNGKPARLIDVSDTAARLELDWRLAPNTSAWLKLEVPDGEAIVMRVHGGTTTVAAIRDGLVVYRTDAVFDDVRSNAQPPRPDPARPEPARPEPARPEPARPEPARPEANVLLEVRSLQEMLAECRTALLLEQERRRQCEDSLQQERATRMQQEAAIAQLVHTTNAQEAEYADVLARLKAIEAEKQGLSDRYTKDRIAHQRALEKALADWTSVRQTLEAQLLRVASDAGEPQSLEAEVEVA